MVAESTDKAKQLIADMRSDRGYLQPEWEFAAFEDTEFLQSYNNLYRAAMMDGQELPAKYKELISIGILAFRNRSSGVKNHINRALRLGATRREILEAIEATVITGGAPTMNCGLNGFVEVFKELEGK